MSRIERYSPINFFQEYIQFHYDVFIPAVAIWFFRRWLSKLIFSSTFKREIGLRFFCSQWGQVTWSRGYWSNSSPPMIGAPRKTKMIKFPFPQAGKCIKCSRVRPGRDVEASIWLANNFDQIFLKPFTPDFFLCGYCGVFFGPANGHGLLCFFDNIFKHTSILPNVEHSEQQVDSIQTQMFDNFTYVAIFHTSF